MKRLIRETEKPSFPAQCRVLAEAAVLWALLAAGAQLLLPAEKTALPEGAALAWAALVSLRPIAVTMEVPCLSPEGLCATCCRC